MINLYNAEINSISIHRVGNKSRNEAPFFSDVPYKLTDELTPLIKEFFLKPFREKSEMYFQLTHEVDLVYNEVYETASQMFKQTENPDYMHVLSKKITQHLYEQSNHPHIKNGEVYVVHFSNVSINNTPVDAIGIFKSEIQSDFLLMGQKGSQLEMDLQHGIALDKLDKGCLIFNYHGETGYRLLCHDSNRYDARYWLEHFLSVDVCEDEHFMTKKYLKFVEQFGKDVIIPAEDKKEQVMFNNRSVNYFAKNDQFEESKFLDEVLDNPDLVSEFHNFKIDKGEKYSVEDVTTFPISNSAVTEARKSIKNIINLDTNISIKMDFINPESAEKFVEKGWDEERQMYYYLVYFNKEVK